MANEIFIIDNDDVSGVEIVGAWKRSTYMKGQFYGPSYLHDDNEGGSKSVRFYPGKKAEFVPGTYNVYLTYNSHDNKGSGNVPVRVTYSYGTKSTSVDQSKGGGQWYYLGEYKFDGAGNECIEISTGGTRNYVVVDAVRFVRSG